MSLFKRSNDGIPSGTKSVVGRSPIWSNPTFSLRQYGLIAGGLLVLAGGVILLAATASPSASLTADNGTLTTGASIQSSTTASDGKGYVEFGGSGSTTYYVSPNGSNSNNGTSASSPWQTVSKVNSFCPKPGDIVLFQGGQ
ncbi:MAG TPA: hypothetical protein VMR75_03870, partial [Candidatus Saccharimonadales bacterium]|nr:hypothetical protein [Candidatus Saccharimonadales bacterium]